MLGFSVLSSLFLGSALGKAVSTLLVYRLNVNFFSAAELPTFSLELAQAKTFDLLDFGLTVGLTAFCFAFLKYFLRSNNRLVNISHVIFNFILFLQVHFATYNLVYLLIFLLLFYGALTVALKTKFKLKDIEHFDSEKLIVLANGLLTGFFLLILVNNFTTTILPLAALLLAPVAYLLLELKYFKSHAHLLLIASIVMPTNLVWLLGVAALTAIALLVFKEKSDFVAKYLYPAVFIILVVYNPLYAAGHFDSVEEGFWLGWLAGVRDGRALYREIAAYHPPLIIWALNIFQNTRLALHLLQITGVIFYYLLAKKLLKNKLSIFAVMLVAVSLTTIMVRNNVEIRLGLGLASLAFFAHPVIAGALAALSLFTSTEVGVAATVAGALGILIFSRQNIFKYIGGFLLVSVPVLIVLVARGGAVPMIEQIGFYANAFSNGYLNLPVERSVNSAFIHWHIVNQYISAYPFFWEIARAGIIAGLIIAIYKKDRLAVSLGVFGLIIFRSALGRSDFYHLLFPFLVSLPLIFFTLEKLNHKYLVPVFSLLLVFVFARNIVNASFINEKLFAFQTYGKQIGEQEKFMAEDEEMAIQYIKQNTSVNQTIFVYPWNPEIYFLAGRSNATKFYTPYAFFSEKYQNEMLQELKASKPTFVVYNSEMKFANLVPDSLPLVNNYILANFSEVASFGNYKILK